MPELASGDHQRILNAQLTRLTRYVEGKRCLQCKARLFVGFIDGEHRVRCLCFPSDPMETLEPNFIQERLGKMVQDLYPDAGRAMTPAPYYGQAQPPMTMQPAPAMVSAAPMTIEEFDNRMELIKHVVQSMELGVHYGVIPNTRDRSLWEPGAEYLRAAFNVAWSWELLDVLEDYHTHEYRYTFHAFQLMGPGVKGPGWTASAWSRERKFWCKAGQDGCPRTCDGSGHGPLGMEAQMLPHNVRDRALKRAFVAMIRNVTGTTGYFKTSEGGDDDVVAERTVDGRASGASRMTDDPNRHQWLKNCPEHDVAWFQTGAMREPAHRQGDGWCNLSKVVGPMVDARFNNEVLPMVEQRGGTRQQANDWIKNNYAGATWSKLKVEQKLQAVDALIARASHAAADAPPQTDSNPDPMSWTPGDPLPAKVDDRGLLLTITEAWDWDENALANTICGMPLDEYLTRHQVNHLYEAWRKMAQV